MNSFPAEGTRRNPIILEDFDDVVQEYKAELAMEELFSSKKKKTSGSEGTKENPICVEDEEIMRRECPMERILKLQRQEDAVKKQLRNQAEGRCWYDSQGWHCMCGKCNIWTREPKYYPMGISLATGTPIPPLEEVRGSIWGSYEHAPEWFIQAKMASYIRK